MSEAKYLAQGIKMTWPENEKHLEIVDQINVCNTSIKMELHLGWFHYMYVNYENKQLVVNKE